ALRRRRRDRDRPVACHCRRLRRPPSDRNLPRGDRDHRRSRRPCLRPPWGRQGRLGRADRPARPPRRCPGRSAPTAAADADADNRLLALLDCGRNPPAGLMMELLAAALGLLGGILAGLFGVGGGILFVPTLVLVLGLTQIHAEATSLLAILPAVLA